MLALLVAEVEGKASTTAFWRARLHQLASESAVVRSVGSSGGQVENEVAKLSVHPGAVAGRTGISLRDATAACLPHDEASLAAATKLGAPPAGPLLELKPHVGNVLAPRSQSSWPWPLATRTSRWSCSTMRLGVPVGGASNCNAAPDRPGHLVALELEAFCMIMLVFPFSGMQNLIRSEWPTSAPE